jgi:putative hydrolase of the HAD superfamily
VFSAIDAAVYSCGIDHAKPHPEAFRSVMAALGMSDPGLRTSATAYEDVQGAVVGMRAVLVPHSDIPPDQQVLSTYLRTASYQLSGVMAWSIPGT